MIGVLSDLEVPLTQRTTEVDKPMMVVEARAVGLSICGALRIQWYDGSRQLERVWSWRIYSVK